jgi:hypothetical protein
MIWIYSVHGGSEDCYVTLIGNIIERNYFWDLTYKYSGITEMESAEVDCESNATWTTWCIYQDLVWTWH